MCGRYSQTLTPRQIDEAFGPVTVPDGLEPNYNVAPTQLAPVITGRNPTCVESFEWGLVPSWSKDGKNNARLINARAETLLDKPSFRKPARERRCLVLADSFYEWRREGKRKQPFRIRRASDGGPDGTRPPIAFAGLWEYWRDRDNPEHERLTFSIITTAPNREMRAVHDRMPVVLPSAELQRAWLGELTDGDIRALTATPPDHTLELYEVAPLVNSVRNNGPELHEALE